MPVKVLPAGTRSRPLDAPTPITGMARSYGHRDCGQARSSMPFTPALFAQWAQQ